MSEYTPKMVHLPGTKLTPEVVLHRTLNKLDRIKAVVILIQWDDCSFDADWSQMLMSELCMAYRVLDKHVDATLLDGKNIMPDKNPPAA